MRRSLRFKITSVMVLCMMTMILLCWILNKSFLEDYYQRTKVTMLGSSFDALKEQLSGEEMYDILSLTEEQRDRIYELIYELSFGSNIDIYIINQRMIVRSNTSKTAQNRMTASRITYVLGGGSGYDIEDVQLLYTNGEYDVYSQTDRSQKSNYIDLYGILDNNLEVFIRANYESIQESAAIASRFLAYVGLFVVALGTVVIFLISRNFTRPILELAEISKKMAELDFDVKYHGESRDEVALLGSSMNELSEKLERTISELKSANNELQSDIQNKIQIDEMRKDFLSNVTHELKTPIALIQGYAEGLQDNINDDAESREFYCDVIIDEAQKMNKMVKKLLTLNQIEFGQNQVELERFDIVALIRSVIGSVDIIVKQKGVRLIFDESEPVYVWADEYMIEEVITNYVSNALNHVSGANIIEVKLVRRGDVVRAAVYNTGDRIPEDELENIWIKFYKVDKARTREYGGSGIGLSIVRAIMDSHHRECGVINHENGVEFWCELDAHV
ncbi:MAG: HAMP domain-containing histidine kinase [Lachnospiraceae bacterium]|nr:HAMP domain-containing histidine kinase [Lachnospiraceae bacterium]